MAVDSRWGLRPQLSLPRMGLSCQAKWQWTPVGDCDACNLLWKLQKVSAKWQWTPVGDCDANLVSSTTKIARRLNGSGLPLGIATIVNVISEPLLNLAKWQWTPVGDCDDLSGQGLRHQYFG